MGQEQGANGNEGGSPDTYRGSSKAISREKGRVRREVKNLTLSAATHVPALDR